jgi:hypothetical protein
MRGKSWGVKLLVVAAKQPQRYGNSVAVTHDLASGFRA